MRQVAEWAAVRPALWRVNFFARGKEIPQGELISPEDFNKTGPHWAGCACPMGDLPQTSQMDLFSMFG